MEKNNNYILGLDLGVASVGFGIIEKDTYNVIKYGVRLFDERDAKENLTRRTLRGARRLKSRRVNRINAIKHLLVNNGIVDESYLGNDYPKLNNIYEIRVKGLHNKLNNDELANVLINIAKRRGSSLEVAIDENDTDAKKTGSSLSNNSRELLENKQFICEHQLEKIKTGTKLRDSDNIYKTEDYIKEVKQILSNQGLDEDINKKIIEIISRRRDFSEGPGSEKFPTKYGSYRYNFIDGKYVLEHVNLIDIMRGKCSVFKDEPRIAKNTYTACLFNLLNDLNNIKINNETYITTNQKKEIIDEYINKKGGITVNQLLKYLKVDLDHLTGFRIDKNSKPLITTFDAYKKILPHVSSVITDNKELFDDVIEILTKTLVVEKRKEELNDLFKTYNVIVDDESINYLCNLTRINGYHSLSKKAMNIIIPELIETNKNQMQIITENNLGKDNKQNIGSKILFNNEYILSPVTKRVHNETIKILNELRKEYGEFDSIVIETTRAKNKLDEKKQFENTQKYFEEQKKKVEELLLEMDKDPTKYNSQTKLKLRLYKEQECKTIYAGLPIDLETLLNDESAYQIEHIIPYAVSFDNSINNKALASAKENYDKGKRSPWGYFSSGKVQECNGPITTWSEFETLVLDNKNFSKKKKMNLLNQEDISKYVNMKDYISRNLNDTSYAIRSIMNTLKDYYKANGIDTKIFTVKGKFTSDFRNKVGLRKDRDYYIHHAIDALIIAGSKNQKIFNKAYQLETLDDITYNKNTGEVIDFNDSPLEDKTFIQFVAKLKDIKCLPEYFSYKVDKKTNRQFADRTIYSTRKYEDGEYVIGKYKDIYGSEGESLKKLFDTGNSNKLLIYRNDIKTYNILKDIYEFYKSEKNPFAKYKEEHGPIRKYSKNGNGPEINQIKYIDKQLGNCIDISSNYSLANSTKRVILDSIKPYRIDIYKSNDGIYKMVTVFRNSIREKEDGTNYIYNYDELKNRKNIQENDEFMFSLNKNDFIEIVKKESNFVGIYTGLKNEKENLLEFKNIEQATNKRITFSINKSILKMIKYNVSPTGKRSKVLKEDLKLEWK